MDLLDTARDAIVRRHFEDLVPFTKLAEEFRSNPPTLRRWMLKNGIRPRNQQEAGALRRLRYLNETGNADSEILRLRVEEGMKIKDIQDRLAVSYRKIQAVLNAAGVGGTTQDRAEKPQRPLRGRARLSASKADVVAAISDGLSCAQLAWRFGVAKSTVLRWLNDEGLKLNPLTELQERIISLWKASDLNMKAVSDQLQCSRTTVCTTLRKVGLIDHRTKLGRPPGSAKAKRSIIYRRREQNPDLLAAT
jgi:transposase